MTSKIPEEYRKYRTTELRQMLLDAGYTEEDVVNIKGKAALVESVQSLDKQEKLDELTFQEVESESDSLVDAVSDGDVSVGPPDRLSHGWHDYVMSKFFEDELENGCPKVDGLRRVAQLLIGKIVRSQPVHTDLKYYDQENYSAMTNYVLEFELDNYEILTYGATADAGVYNCDRPYHLHPVAVSESRAEARAFKKALGLRCLTAEEATAKGKESSQMIEDNGGWDEEELINDHQVKFIEVLCDKLDIDIEKFINTPFYSGAWEEPKYEDLDEWKKKATKGEAASMIRKLNSYQNDVKGSNEVPAELKLN